ncbi:MAG: transposase [Flavobacteriales bacterium]|nr:transposase [Flavobacteriales bacterium]
MTTDERRRRRFTKEFRKAQVKLIESGSVTIQQVCKLYEVKVGSVQLWVKRFGTKPVPSTIVISDVSDYSRLKELEKENQRLLTIIGQQQVELVYHKTLVDLAKSKLGEDYEKK